MADGGNWRDDSEPEWDLRQRGLPCQSYHLMADTGQSELLPKIAEGGSWRDESEPQIVPRPSGLYGLNFQVQCEQASAEICIVMNCIGYGPEIRQARRDAYRDWGRLLTKQEGMNIKSIITGSKAEGLTRFLESDTDMMHVVKDVICIEDGIDPDSLPREKTVFTLSYIGCYHGHCRLILKRPGNVIPVYIYIALCYENGLCLLNSDQFFASVNTNHFLNNDSPKRRAGPSQPGSLAKYLNFDSVFSVPCRCPSILQRWAKRSRHWPSTAIVQKVVSLGAYVTPVAYKGSKHRQVEWRIGFNKGENELVSSLNNTQVYIYVLLKMVVKEVLKPVKKEITSYMVKNIVLWKAENNPQYLFDEKSLFYWLYEGLEKLRASIMTEHLPYYMIPERNLMAACELNGDQKRTWEATISEMMNEGPKFILRLSKIRQAVISHPEPMMWYCKMRVELELLNLKQLIRLQNCKDENGEKQRVQRESDPILQAVQARLREIGKAINQRLYWEGCTRWNIKPPLLMLM